MLRARPLGDSVLSRHAPHVWRCYIQAVQGGIVACSALTLPLDSEAAVGVIFALWRAVSVLKSVGAVQTCEPEPADRYCPNARVLLQAARIGFHARTVDATSRCAAWPADADPVAGHIGKLQADCVPAFLVYVVRHLCAMPAEWGEEAIAAGLLDLVGVHTRQLIDNPSRATGRDLYLLFVTAEQVTALVERQPRVGPVCRAAVERIAATILRPLFERQADAAVVEECEIAANRAGLDLVHVHASSTLAFTDAAIATWGRLLDLVGGRRPDSARTPCWYTVCAGRTTSGAGQLVDNAKVKSLKICSRCKIAEFDSSYCAAESVHASRAQLMPHRAWAEHKLVCPLLAAV